MSSRRGAHRLVVLGAGGVGKTSLVRQFLVGFFSSAYRPTVEDCYCHTLQLPNGLFHSLDILDTAGAHPFPAMRALSVTSGRAFVIVFAVNSRHSFLDAAALWRLVHETKGTSNVPVVVVGNKVDLEEERQVSREEAEAWVANAMPNAAYVETSAKYNVNVKELFKQLLILTYGCPGQSTPPTAPPARCGRIRSVGDLLEVIRRRSSFGLSSHSPGQSASHSPGQSASHSPGQSASHSPGQSASHSPGRFSANQSLDLGSSDDLNRGRSCDDIPAENATKIAETTAKDDKNAENAEENAENAGVSAENGENSRLNAEKSAGEKNSMFLSEKEKKKRLKKLLKKNRARDVNKRKLISASCSALPDDVGSLDGGHERRQCVLL